MHLVFKSYMNVFDNHAAPKMYVIANQGHSMNCYEVMFKSKYLDMEGEIVLTFMINVHYLCLSFE